jgi:hypothetical protein
MDTGKQPTTQKDPTQQVVENKKKAEVSIVETSSWQDI